MLGGPARKWVWLMGPGGASEEFIGQVHLFYPCQHKTVDSIPAESVFVKRCFINGHFVSLS